MFGKQYSGRSLIREALSENNVGSAKRLLGAIIIMICLGLICYFAIVEGATDNVKSLIETSLIIACALLGLSSITSIWKRDENSDNNTAKSSYYEDESTHYCECDDDLGDVTYVPRKKQRIKNTSKVNIAECEDSEIDA